MTCSEPMVPGLHGGLTGAEIRVGRDMSLIGFRDNSVFRCLDPPPSCFPLDFGPLGQAVAEVICDLAAGRAPTRPGALWPMALRVIASIGMPPGE